MKPRSSRKVGQTPSRPRVAAIAFSSLLLVHLLVFLESRRLVRLASAPRQLAGAIEAENLLPVQEKSGPFPVVRQDMPREWSSGAQLFGQATRPGDWVELPLPRLAAGSYRLSVFCTRAPDYGIIRLFVDGRPIGAEQDLFAPGTSASGEIAVGPIALNGRSDRLRIRVIGKNPASRNFYWGIDALMLRAM
jgi:hypothetical protein